MVKFIEAESRMVIAKAWQGGENGVGAPSKLIHKELSLSDLSGGSWEIPLARLSLFD